MVGPVQYVHRPLSSLCIALELTFWTPVPSSSTYAKCIAHWGAERSTSIIVYRLARHGDERFSSSARGPW